MAKKRLAGGLIAVAVFAGTVVAATAFNAGGSSGSTLAEAEALRVAGDLRGARVALLNAVRENPKSAKALLAQAEVALALFDGAGAEAALERAVALGTPPPSVAHLLGHALWMQGRLDEAEGALTDARDRAYASRILGRVQMDRGDLVAAQANFDEALRLAPRDSRNWTDLARLRFVSADQRGAVEALERALQIDPRDIRALEFRGVLMRSQFGVVAALPWFERGLQIAPDDVPLLEQYGATLGEAGRNRDMLAQARRIVALDSANPRGYYLQAVLAARAGNCALAKRILPRIGDDFADLPGPMLFDAVCEYELGNFNRAVERLQELLARQPRNRTVRKLLAQAMYRSGAPLDALDTIREIAGRGDADSYSLTIAARAFEASDQRERAAAPLDDAAIAVVRPALPLPEPVSLLGAADAARREPDNARAVLPFIRLLAAAGDDDAALAEAIRLRNANGGVADAHLIVGDIELARGNLPAAIAAFAEARRIAFTEPVMLRLVDALGRNREQQAADEVLAAFLAHNPMNLTALRLAGYRNLDAGQFAAAAMLLGRVRRRVGHNDSVLLANLARAQAGAGRLDAAVENAAIAYRVAPMNAFVVRVYADVLKRSGKRPKAARELAVKAAVLAGAIEIP